MTDRRYLRNARRWALIAAVVTFLPLLSGCLEQLQTTRLASGTLTNFYLHLRAGELDDARTYFAPGLVALTPELDQQLRDASVRLRRYDIQLSPARTDKLNDGTTRVTLPGKVRLRAEAGQPTPTPDGGWQSTDIISAREVERGPGWRILDFELKCCP